MLHFVFNSYVTSACKNVKVSIVWGIDRHNVNILYYCNERKKKKKNYYKRYQFVLVISIQFFFLVTKGVIVNKKKKKEKKIPPRLINRKQGHCYTNGIKDSKRGAYITLYVLQCTLFFNRRVFCVAAVEGMEKMEH